LSYRCISPWLELGETVILYKSVVQIFTPLFILSKGY